MFRMVICCGGGMSSSSLVSNMNKQLHEMHMEEQVSVAFCPFYDLVRHKSEYDVALLCPHLLHSAKRQIEEGLFNDLPLYMIPPRMYGLMNFQYLYEDALDIVELFKQNPINLCHFENEENVLAIKRIVSHRRNKEQEIRV